MARVRLSVDVEPELRRRVKIAAASKDQSVKKWMEGALERALAIDEIAVPTASVGEEISGEDRAWLGGDLSRLGEFEPYEWEEGELEEGKPMRYEPGAGFIVEGGKAGVERRG
jgi:hypothetical protein